MPVLTDLHSHTYPASHDGKHTLLQMVEAAIQKGLAYYGISNHIDWDCDLSKLPPDEAARVQNGDPALYFREARQIQTQVPKDFTLLVGAELGFCPSPNVEAAYRAFCDTYQPDYIINSVHSIHGVDYARATIPHDRGAVYKKYLQTVRESLDAAYPYDIVGHFEYVVRYVPFEEKSIDIREFANEIDDILCTVIQKGKILEVNTATYGLDRITIPGVDILKRYYQLGGRHISFGSDAHAQDRLMDKREAAVALLKEIGFTHLTVPQRGKYLRVPLSGEMY